MNLLAAIRLKNTVVLPAVFLHPRLALHDYWTLLTRFLKNEHLRLGLVFVGFHGTLEAGELALHYLGRIALFNAIRTRVHLILGSVGGDHSAP